MSQQQSGVKKKKSMGKKAMKAKGLSVLVVCGLYGAGKSSLIRKIILEEKKNVKIALYCHSSTTGTASISIFFSFMIFFRHYAFYHLRFIAALLFPACATYLNNILHQITSTAMCYETSLPRKAMQT